MTKEREKNLIKRVKENCYYLNRISEEEQTDRVIDAAMEWSPLAFWWIKDESKKTLERCVKAVRGNKILFEYVPEDMRDRVKEELEMDSKKRKYKKIYNICFDAFIMLLSMIIGFLGMYILNG